MIDIHIHAIPMVDDGPGSFEESIGFLKYAAENGTRQMIATPHFYFPRYVNESVQTNYEKLLEHIKQENIDMKLHLGNELHLSEEGVSELIKGNANSLAGSSYVLVELPEQQFYSFHDDLIFRIQLEGFKVILAHIERYKVFKKSPEKLKEFIQRGAFAQMSASYITNRDTRSKALELINSKCVHIVASDGHNLLLRKPNLKEAYDIVAQKISKGVADTLFQVNPSLIIENMPSLMDL